MGAGESKLVSAGRSADLALLGCVTERVTEFYLPERLPAGSARECSIADDDGDPWFRVARPSAEQTVLCNAWTGEPAAVIQRRAWSSSRSCFRIFACTPNTPYQEPTDSLTMSDVQAGVTTQRPLYLFGKVFEEPEDEEDRPVRLRCGAPSVLWQKDPAKEKRPQWSCSYSRYRGNESGPELWTVSASGRSGQMDALEIKPADDDRKCVARIDQSSHRTNEAGEPTRAIRCAPGVDPLEAMCVCVIMDMITDGGASVTEAKSGEDTPRTISTAPSTADNSPATSTAACA